MRNILVILSLVLVCAVSYGVSAYAVDSTKPSTHNANWTKLHGQAAKANEAECFTCHDERNECISCHEDVAPRSHTSMFVNKTHGLESRWNKDTCATCHREDFCVACHDTAYPQSHTRPGFGDNKQSPTFHCETSCQLPAGNWKNTPSKNCIVCHQTQPIRKSGEPHEMR